MKIVATGLHIHDGHQELSVDLEKGEWLNIEPQEDSVSQYVNIVSNKGSIWVLRESFKLETIKEG